MYRPFSDYSLSFASSGTYNPPQCYTAFNIPSLAVSIIYSAAETRMDSIPRRRINNPFSLRQMKNKFSVANEDLQ